MKRKLVALFMVMAMTLTMVTGCGKGDNNDSSSKDTSSNDSQDLSTTAGAEEQAANLPTDDLTQSRTIKVWAGTDDYKGLYTSYNDNPVVSYLDSKFNMKLDYQQPPMGSERDQFNLMLGTGDYPDVIQLMYSAQTDVELSNDGVIKDITDYVKQYMPNYYNYLNDPANIDLYNTFYDDNDRIYSIGIIGDIPEIKWGGIVYRKDIVDTMTGGNPVFPSGNAEPTTIDDLEYMLDLMNQYFIASGMKDYAGLILPSNGRFTTSEFVSGFGVGGDMYLDGETVKFGPIEQGFYNYLVKMRDWYAKGYIYKDFASRTTDMFYMPNTALTYGGAAGVWFGLNSQLGTALSMPEYNLNVLLKPLSTPLDTANGVTGDKGVDFLVSELATPNVSYAISTSCSEENMIRYMTAMDFLFSAEGSEVKTFGLDAEHGSADSTVLQTAGLAGGTYTKDASGNMVLDPLMDGNSGKRLEGYQALIGLRLPGIFMEEERSKSYSDEFKEAGDVWTKYGNESMHYSFNIRKTAEENATKAGIDTNVNDYINSMIPKFIMGTEELSEETWASYVEQVKSLGIEEGIAISQAAYDRTKN